MVRRGGLGLVLLALAITTACAAPRARVESRGGVEPATLAVANSSMDAVRIIADGWRLATVAPGQRACVVVPGRVPEVALQAEALGRAWRVAAPRIDMGERRHWLWPLTGNPPVDATALAPADVGCRL